MKYIIDKNRIHLENEKHKVMAEILFPVINGDITITHTYVDDSLRGQGIAGEMMDMVCEILRVNEVKCVVECSYAKKYFEKNEIKQYHVKNA